MVCPLLPRVYMNLPSTTSGTTRKTAEDRHGGQEGGPGNLGSNPHLPPMGRVGSWVSHQAF